MSVCVDGWVSEWVCHGYVCVCQPISVTGKMHCNLSMHVNLLQHLCWVKGGKNMWAVIYLLSPFELLFVIVHLYGKKGRILHLLWLQVFGILWHSCMIAINSFKRRNKLPGFVCTHQHQFKPFAHTDMVMLPHLLVDIGWIPVSLLSSKGVGDRDY